MSEQTAEVAETEAPKPDAPAEEAPAQETDWRAEARKWEQRAKSNKDAADRIATIEAEKAQLAEKVTAYETKEKRAQLVSEVSQEAGVPAEVLRGNTREELEAHAEVLKALIKPSGPVIPGQERAPQKVEADPVRQFAKSLFANAKTE